MIKLNVHVEGTIVGVAFTKVCAEKCVLGDIFISEILFRFSAE